MGKRRRNQREGKKWLQLRQILNNALLKNPKAMDEVLISYQHVLDDHLNHICELSQISRGIIPDIQLEMQTFGLQSLASMFMGTRHQENMENIEINLVGAVTSVSKMFACSQKLLTIPPQIAKFFRLPVWNAFVESVTETMKITANWIREGINSTRNPEKFHSLLKDGILYNMIFEEEATDKDIIQLITDSLIRDSQTVAITYQWVIYALAQHHEVQNAILEEVNTVCGSENKLCIEHLPNMKYTAVVFKEILRMYPTTAFSTRRLTHDHVVGGYKFPAGKFCTISLYASHYNPEYFSQPHRFWPERWFKNEDHDTYEGVTQPFAYQPFGFGARSCPGRIIAENMFIIFIGRLVQRFIMECEEVKTTFISVLLPNPKIQLKLLRR